MKKSDLFQPEEDLAPNPQFERSNWIELRGTWDFASDADDIGEESDWVNDFPKQQTIEVPYVQESNRDVPISNQADVIWYQKKIEVPASQKGKKALINFEAVDYLATVWINGKKCTVHEGGFDPFQVVYQLSKQEDELIITLRVEDNHRSDQPLGKQSWKGHNFLCWYTKTTGIWQTVWAEFVSDTFLESVEMTPDIDLGVLNLAVHTSMGSAKNAHYDLRVEVKLNEQPVKSIVLKQIQEYTESTIPVDSDYPDFRLAYWSPDQPHLYDIIFTLEKDGKAIDQVKSYFGMRNIGVRGKDIVLNNERFYQKLILDQGYYGETLMTPPNSTIEYEDLVKIKEMGFNGLRKHQTVSSHRYLYLCDKLGLVVWAEMPSSYLFHTKTVQRAYTQWQEIVKKHRNHPSVIIYTVMNESWGANEVFKNEQQQHFVNSLYTLTKALDGSRLVVGNDGWEHTMTDILTIHDYSQNSKLLSEAYLDVDQFVNEAPSKTSKKYNYASGYCHQEQPVLLSEFGGVAYADDLDEEAWGYGDRPKSKEEAFGRIEDLVKSVIDNEHFCGFCYTQLSDVEQEINGLLTHDHQHKFDPAKVRKLLNYKHAGGFVFE